MCTHAGRPPEPLQPHSPGLSMAPQLVQCSAVLVLKFLTLERGLRHLHFCTGAHTEEGQLPTLTWREGSGARYFAPTPCSSLLCGFFREDSPQDAASYEWPLGTQRQHSHSFSTFSVFPRPRLFLESLKWVFLHNAHAPFPALLFNFPKLGTVPHCSRRLQKPPSSLPGNSSLIPRVKRLEEA